MSKQHWPLFPQLWNRSLADATSMEALPTQGLRSSGRRLPKGRKGVGVVKPVRAVQMLLQLCLSLIGEKAPPTTKKAGFDGGLPGWQKRHPPPP
eukprot:CAMPEP_0174366914 /NCGR_PEP_ID=MMETSP0811_2-20130205/83104_1 /TAXON_ID=73025 ORGANISM="Eutreptiella gymnastica-like, Strain CCMP1594" /NCGR_SAMPLE_ID=MMETSP0811_2 /ASSEMBLY_ACC=CAM_ASM_000667 /LENGTH=93 /DNA_ID=CAMNT_0015508937 /DNA_START=231 /DNA_END=508 /DNA_ORIENTATION=+